MYLDQIPVCEPLPRDTVLLAYLRRDDYVVRAVDPYLNPRWNVSVGEIICDELDETCVGFAANIRVLCAFLGLMLFTLCAVCVYLQ